MGLAFNHGTWSWCFFFVSWFPTVHLSFKLSHFHCSLNKYHSYCGSLYCRSCCGIALYNPTCMLSASANFTFYTPMFDCAVGVASSLRLLFFLSMAEEKVVGGGEIWDSCNIWFRTDLTSRRSLNKIQAQWCCSGVGFGGLAVWVWDEWDRRKKFWLQAANYGITPPSHVPPEACKLLAGMGADGGWSRASVSVLTVCMALCTAACESGGYMTNDRYSILLTHCSKIQPSPPERVGRKLVKK